MNWSDVPEPSRLKLLEQWRQDRSLTTVIRLTEECRLEMNPLTLLRRLQELDKAERVKVDALNVGILPPTVKRPTYSAPVIKTDNLILISDMEIPDQDDAMMQAALLLGIKNNIRELAIIGDATKEDVFASWVKTITSPEDFETEMDLFGHILKYWLKWFHTIHIRPGNHDQRVARITDGQVHLGTFLKGMGYKGRISYHPFRKMWVQTSKGYVALYHQKNSSSDGVTVARKMYNVEEGINGIKPYQIWTTHSHHAGWVKSDDGLCDCFALGCTRDPKKTLYYNETPTTASKWTQSIGMIKNGYGKNYERRVTDWEEVLGEYYPKSLIRQDSR